MKSFQTGPFTGGVNSLVEGTLLPDTQYSWAVNTINRGGIVATRPGLVGNPLKPAGSLANLPDHAFARAITVFTPKNGKPLLVVAITSEEGSNSIYYQQYPFGGPWYVISGLLIPQSATKVVFETAVKAVKQDAQGSLTEVDPYPVLMISNDAGRLAYWDGVTAAYLPFSALWMKWIGNRLWIANGSRIRASDLLDPITFTEEDVLSEGGYFVLSDDCTGMGTTPDYKSLLAFTKNTTSSLQASNTDRTSWGKTAGFQQMLFSNIGCIAGKSIINQYGMTWWMSQGGLIGLDNALQAYRSSKIHYRDGNMARSKANISGDYTSDICSGSFENFLVMSVPSGDSFAAHTWVMDEAMTDTIDQSSPSIWSSVWTGIRPVQWLTTYVEGRTRCFALSNDMPPTGLSKARVPCVWEVFTESYRDIGYDSSGALYGKSIPCSLETKYMGDGMYRIFKYGEIEIDEAQGVTSLSASYSGRRSGYKKILDDLQINATQNALRGAGLSSPTSILGSAEIANYVPQRRLIRTATESTMATDADACVEKEFTGKRDRSFSMLVEWVGKIGISRVRITTDEATDKITGECSDDETTERYITSNGAGVITANSIVYPLPSTDYRSRFVDSVSQRWEETTYQANNG